MFTHLHTHSYYSLLRGIPSPAEMVQAAVDHGMQSLALTDHRFLTGALEFYTTCKSAGIQPILGIRNRGRSTCQDPQWSNWYSGFPGDGSAWLVEFMSPEQLNLR